MNDWYGLDSNNPVKYFEPQASSNEDLEVVYTNRCGGFVTSNCPFTSGLTDSELINNPVVEIYDTANGLCVSASGSATAVLGTCPDDSGNGGSPGNIFVWDSYNGSDILISNKYSNAAGSPECIAAKSGEHDGATMYFNISYGSPNCSEWDQ